jgi:hypothetical protein
MGRVNRHMDPS